MPSTPCPHVSSAMIAAGFTACTACMPEPATTREEPVAIQRAALRHAHDQLAGVLTDLAVAAREAAKRAHSKRPGEASALLGEVQTRWRAVLAAEQTVDLAALDLASASGQDV